MKLKSLIRTCEAFPSQWEGELEDGRWVYGRYRWGVLCVYAADALKDAADYVGECIYQDDDPEFPNTWRGDMSNARFLELSGLQFDGDIKNAESCAWD